MVMVDGLLSGFSFVLGLLYWKWVGEAAGKQCKKLKVFISEISGLGFSNKEIF